MNPQTRRLLAEHLVDTIAEKLGVDTGICHESMFERAVEAAEKILDGMTDERRKEDR